MYSYLVEDFQDKLEVKKSGEIQAWRVSTLGLLTPEPLHTFFYKNQ